MDSTVLHSFWTRPQQEFEIWDFEWLTWALSIMESKKYGPVVMVTDEVGFEYIKQLGLNSLYTEIVVALDNIPDFINTKLFWAAGKLYAIRELRRCFYDVRAKGVLSVDLDCIPWALPPLLNACSCLNNEDVNFDWYKGTREKYGQYVNIPMNWQAPPANNGLIHFQHYNDAVAYADISIKFMEKFSALSAQNNFWGNPEHEYGDAMTFAEQQVLPSAAEHMGHNMIPLLPADSKGFLHMNRFVTHLWSTKRLYKAFPEARDHYLRSLHSYLSWQYPRLAWIVAQQKILKNVRISPDMYKAMNKEAFHYHQLNDIAIATEKGTLYDRNLPIFPRTLQEGSIILPGDQFVPARSSFKKSFLSKFI